MAATVTDSVLALPLQMFVIQINGEFSELAQSTYFPKEKIVSGLVTVEESLNPLYAPHWIILLVCYRDAPAPPPPPETTTPPPASPPDPASSPFVIVLLVTIPVIAILATVISVLVCRGRKKTALQHGSQRASLSVEGHHHQHYHQQPPPILPIAYYRAGSPQQRVPAANFYTKPAGAAAAASVPPQPSAAANQQSHPPTVIAWPAMKPTAPGMEGHISHYSMQSQNQLQQQQQPLQKPLSSSSPVAVVVSSPVASMDPLFVNAGSFLAEGRTRTAYPIRASSPSARRLSVGYHRDKDL